MERRYKKRRMIDKPNQYPPSGRPERHFRDALYASLLHLRPKYCLEIGTHIGQSTLVFQEYFNKHQPDGIVITVDITKLVNITSPNVKQLIVYPHVSNSSDHHEVDENLLTHEVDSVTENTEIIKEAIRNLSEVKFDFCFLDGDHQLQSVLNDFEISRNVLSGDQYILLDDTEEDHHDSKTVYNRIVAEQSHNTYDFSKEWGCYCGCALIWNKKTPPSN
jgi:cephalosporin hydroxylase